MTKQYILRCSGSKYWFDWFVNTGNSFYKLEIQIEI